MAQQQPGREKVWHSGWLLPALALVLAGQVRAAEWSIDPTLEVGEAYTDNVELTENGSDEFITEATPGLNVSRVAPQFQSEASYRFQNLWYKDNTDFDDRFHNFRGTADAQFLNNALTINARGNYDQQNIDPERAVGFSNLLRTGNRTDVARAQITPAYGTSLAPHVDTSLLYSYNTVRYVNTDDTTTDVEDSHRHFVRAVFGDLTDPGLIDWQTNYQYSRTEFDGDGDSFEYQRVGAQLGYAINPRTRWLFSGGKESDVEDDIGSGDLDAWYWDTGLSWRPNSRQTLEARVGERYFGRSYFFSWSRQARRTKLDANYTEEAVTQNNALFDLGGSGAPSGTPRGSLDPDVYIRRRFGAGLQLTASRNVLNFDAYYEDREYQESDRNEQTMGMRVGWNLDLGRRTTLTSSIYAEHRKYSDDDDIYRFRADLRRELSRTLSGRLSLGRLVRNTQTGTPDYRANGVALYLIATF